jgi:hypothetical protein
MARRALALVAVVAVALFVLACPKKVEQSATAPATGGKRSASLFFTVELKGEIEPCGCNSDPLGDLARLAALIADTRKTRPAGLIDGGSTLFASLEVAPADKAQAELKARLIETQLPRLGLLAAGLGAYDLSGGRALLAPPRQAANAPPGFPVEAPKLVELGGIKIGIFGLVDALAVPGATDMGAAARTQIAALRHQGAQVVVMLAQVDREGARALVKAAPGADLVVAGKDAKDPQRDRPWPGIEQAGPSIILQPYQRGQSVIRVDLTIDPQAGPGLVDAMGEARAKELASDLRRSKAELDDKIAGWKKQADADPGFIATKEQESVALQAKIDDLVQHPERVPAAGSYFTAQHVLIKRQLRCDSEVQDAKRAFEEAAGKANLAGASPAPPLGKGASGYVGNDSEECAFCHKAEVAFWKGTHHAQAWATLVKVGKQWNGDCIGCHVTGWLRPGGASFAANDTLHDVQCEQCHGPAQRHVDADGKDKTSLMAPGEKTCLHCHTPEHSDTFSYEAYLRDVTGPGHAAALRKALGEGPTGHELRQTALEAAGRGIGAGCTK